MYNIKSNSKTSSLVCYSEQAVYRNITESHQPAGGAVETLVYN